MGRPAEGRSGRHRKKISGQYVKICMNFEKINGVFENGGREAIYKIYLNFIKKIIMSIF